LSFFTCSFATIAANAELVSDPSTSRSMVCFAIGGCAEVFFLG
jgi:hypothetical protein